MKKPLIIISFGLIGWALCGGIMFGGMALFSLETAVITHAIAAPAIFFGLSWIYFKKMGYTTPLQTGFFFLFTAVFLDVFIVSLVINRSFEMFESLWGTWIPLLLIFLSTFAAGSLVGRSTRLQK